MSSQVLPQDIQIQILVRLPVRSLLCFRSVCRSWNSLITSKEFITLHLNQSLQARDPLILLYSNDLYSMGVCKRKPYSFYRDDGETITKVQELEFPIKNEYYHCCAACNGLLCFYHYDPSRMSLAVWNPSIRTFYRLPCRTWPIMHIYHHCDVGIGYDQMINQYKVLALIYPLKLDYEHPISFDVEVIVLGMDQWRRVNTRVPTSALFLCGSPIFLRGSIHWLGYRSVISVVILAFDVHEEVFLEMEVPSAIVQASGYSLHVHGESLCLLDNRCSRDSGAVPFWVMKQYGEKQSWCKQFIIEIHDHSFRVLGFWKEDKILIENIDGEMVSYDRKVRSTKVVLASEEGTYRVSKYDLAIPYMECLVLLKGSDGLESRVDGSSSNI